LDVKISELPAWIGRRDKSIGAIYNETLRNIWRVHTLYYSGRTVFTEFLLIILGPVYGNIVKTIFRFIFAFMFANWFFKQANYWEVKKNLYHW
jgi:hypothetical protein